MQQTNRYLEIKFWIYEKCLRLYIYIYFELHNYLSLSYFIPFSIFCTFAASELIWIGSNFFIVNSCALRSIHVKIYNNSLICRKTMLTMFLQYVGLLNMVFLYTRTLSSIVWFNIQYFFLSNCENAKHYWILINLHLINQ